MDEQATNLQTITVRKMRDDEETTARDSARRAFPSLGDLFFSLPTIQG
jgi:hypothetical protein